MHRNSPDYDSSIGPEYERLWPGIFGGAITGIG